MLGGEVQAVAPDAVLADQRDAGLLQRVADVELERVELGCLGGLPVELLAARLGVGEVEPQEVAAALGAFGVHVGGGERRDRDHPPSRAGDGDVQPALAAFSLSGPKR